MHSKVPKKSNHSTPARRVGKPLRIQVKSQIKRHESSAPRHSASYDMVQSAHTKMALKTHKSVEREKQDRDSVELHQADDRQNLRFKDPNEIKATVEYSAITVTPTNYNSAKIHPNKVPEDIVNMTRVDRYCHEDTKEASQYGLPFEDEMDCNLPPRSSNTTNNNNTNKRNIHTINRRRFSTEKKPPAPKQRQSVFDDEVYYNSYNLIGDVKVGWKRPEEIDQLPDEYFDGSAEKRQTARQHVTAIKKITEEYLNPSLLDVRETHFHSGNTNKKPSSTNAV
jgi:hypothetical protein